MPGSRVTLLTLSSSTVQLYSFVLRQLWENCHFLKISPPFSGFNKMISIKIFSNMFHSVSRIHIMFNLNRDIKKSPQIWLTFLCSCFRQYWFVDMIPGSVFNSINSMLRIIIRTKFIKTRYYVKEKKSLVRKLLFLNRISMMSLSELMIFYKKIVNYVQPCTSLMLIWAW